MQPLLQINPNFHEEVCPWIMGNGFAKRVIALQLFSNPQAGEKFNVLMVGDPGSGKTDILNFVRATVPGGGGTKRNVSPMGIFEKMQDSVGGIFCIDEFDKISDDAREMLLEVMQEHTISDDKFGRHYTKSARLNILACCNPSNNFLTDDPLFFQMNFSVYLMTRFHMLIPFKQVDSKYYGDIALLHKRLKNEEEMNNSSRRIKEYLLEAREKVPSVEIPEIITKRIGGYIGRLKEQSSFREVISYRCVEGFTSFVKARSRMLLKPIADEEDFKYIKEIFDRVYL